MPSWLCKIWRLLLNIVSKIIEIAVQAVKMLLDVAVEALDGLVGALVGEGGLSRLLLIGGLGLLAWWLLTRDDKNEESPTVQIQGVEV